MSKIITLFVTRKWLYYVKELFCNKSFSLLIEVFTYFFAGETTGNLRISEACNALISCHQLYEFTRNIVDPKSRNALRYLTMYIQIGKKRFPSKNYFMLLICGH